MGRQDLFPLLVFGIVLMAALASILAINQLLSPGGSSLQENVVGQSSYIVPVLDPLLFAPADDPFTTQSFEYLTASGTTQGLAVDVRTEPGVTQLVYKRGYYLKNDVWTIFTFPDATVGTSNWIPGTASVEIDTLLSEGSSSVILVYVCRKYAEAGQYICGPKGTQQNLAIKNWTAAAVIIPPQTQTIYTCYSDPDAFCAPANTSPLTGSKMLFTPSVPIISGVNYQLCPTPSHLCYKCSEGYTNTSSGACVQSCTANSDCGAGKACQAGTCVVTTSCADPCTGTGTRCMADGKVQTCVSGCWNTPQACTGTGMTCFDTTCTSAVLNACTLTPGNICAANTPANRTATTGLCTGTSSCFRCADGYTYNAASGTCIFSCNTNNCPSPKVCTATACTTPSTPTSCTINSQTYANGVQNTANSCQYCNVALSSTSWSIRANGVSCTTTSSSGTCSGGVCQPTCTPQCPTTTSVACGQSIMPTNGCGTCAGKGTMCTTGQCNTNTWQCEPTCTPLTKAQACGTKQCGTASNGCGGTFQCGSSNGACPSGQTCNAQQQCVQNAVCTIGDTKCQLDDLWYREYSCVSGQWQVSEWCTDACSADGKTCGTSGPAQNFKVDIIESSNTNAAFMITLCKELDEPLASDLSLVISSAGLITSPITDTFTASTITQCSLGGGVEFAPYTVLNNPAGGYSMTVTVSGSFTDANSADNTVTKTVFVLAR